ncbi:MAG: 2-C-methyl-D-erythritol 2,4-cyclodiphosphate synthase [Candidatus Alcyoniella australis]|nr:2-C-methyl-D-erythritol 2,4-cyclodiphosphate synthase [Candidatus Alcyoniella australis]
MRVGHGFDVHRLVPGRRLILGGVQIEHPLGLEGHSDADVLAHAVADALLGAAGLGDIGRHFPDDDSQYRGADSLELLSRVAELITQGGLTVGNVDATIIAQAPRMAPHIEPMQTNLARAMSIAPVQVNVKATTTEGLGYIGEGLGIAAHAVALLELISES